MENKKKKIPVWVVVAFKSIEWCLIILLVGCMLTLFSQKICGETPSLFGYSIYTVVTDSMEPTYKVGDVILCKNIKKVEPSDIKEKDVVVFIAPHGFDVEGRLEGKIVTHRVEKAPFLNEENGEYYIRTKGDNALSQDRVAVPLDNIKGVVKAKSGGITKLVGFLSKWYGFVLVIVTPLVIILFLQIRVLMKEKEREQQKLIELKKQEEIEKFKKEQLESEIKKKAIQEYLENKEKNGVNQ